MKNISIITHKNTDIDAFASVISLAETIIHFTNDKNYNVFPILENFKTSLDIKTKIKLYTLDDVKDKKMDYVIVCDVNEEDRVYGIEIFDTIPIENRFLIDHHDKNRNELHVLPKNKLLNPHACSTSEIIADVLKNSPVDDDLFSLPFNNILNIVSKIKFSDDDENSISKIKSLVSKILNYMILLKWIINYKNIIYFYFI